MDKILFRLSKLLFVIFMTVILILVLFFQDMSYACKKTFLISNGMIAISIMITLIVMMGAEVLFSHADYRLLSARVLKKFAKFEEVNLFL